MAVSLSLVPEASLDVRDAYAWYERRRPGLGEEFLSSVEACLEAIRRRPEMCAPLHENYRRALTRRFPYAVLRILRSDDRRLWSASYLSEPRCLATADLIVGFEYPETG